MEHYKEIDEVVGTSFGDIAILDTISRGGSFSVLKARYSTKFVTLKVANLPDAMHTELLRREYELGSTLSHGSIITTLGFEEYTEAGAAIVMEYIEGETLDEFVASKPSRQARESVLRDILDGVEYLHHRGLLHNDLKPQNIIINSKGAARIIDFGLSVSDDSLWQGCVGGSADFSAPEILRGEGPAGASSDIYSAGKLIAILFDGQRYGKIVRRCLDSAPEKRYGSVAELRQALARSRQRPFIVTIITFIALAAIAIAAPYLHTAQQSAHHSQNLSEAKKVLNQHYDQMLSRVKVYGYTEFAALARGLYTMRFMEYRNTLPEGRRLAAEEVFAKHISTFDSLMFALPSIATLPKSQQDSLNLILEKWSEEAL